MVGKAISYVFYTTVGVLIALAIFRGVFVLARRYGGNIGATAAATASNLTGTSI